MTAKQRRRRLTGEVTAAADGYVRGMVTLEEWRGRTHLLLVMLARVRSGRVG